MDQGKLLFNIIQPETRPFRNDSERILSIIYWLVVSNIWTIFHFILWDVIFPIDELIFFKMVKTTNQLVLTLAHFFREILLQQTQQKAEVFAAVLPC